jgi:hypothetical protein
VFLSSNCLVNTNLIIKQENNHVQIKNIIGCFDDCCNVNQLCQADEDTTISKFSLADDAKKTKATGKQTRVKENDAWSQANPRETGKWKKENR